VKAGVVGASGYLGAELLRILASHPEIDVAVVQGDSTAGSAVSWSYPGLSEAYPDLTYGAFDPGALGGCDVIFVALPSGRSIDVVPGLVGTGALIVDLGADFRLKDASLYPTWYGWEHTEPELLAASVYGMPEFFRAELATAKLVASPGCFVTAASIALGPLVTAGVVETSSIIVDAATGTSGAGKEPSPATV